MINRYGDVAIVSGTRNASVSFATGDKNEPNVTDVILHTDDEEGKIAAWGPTNDFPQKLLKEIRLNGAALSGLRVSRKAHYGSGFILTKQTTDEKSKKRSVETVNLSDYPEINSFWKRSQMKRFWRETIADLEYFAIAFPEYILSKDYKKITRVKRQNAAHCRFELMDEKSRMIKHVYISTKWAEGVNIDSEFVDKVQLIDSYWSAEEVKEYCKKNKIRKFIRPIFYPLIDESYYPKPEWHSVLNNGWLKFANKIPAAKNAELEDLININYHIQVYEEYFERKYKDDWDTFDVDKKDEIRDSFLQALDDSLSGPDNGGKSIMSLIYKDDNGTPQPGLKIDTIDRIKSDGNHLQDTSAGNQEILTAIGVDPSLIGAGIPGGKLGAGSGSDKREAWLILSAMMKSNRETTLEHYDFLQDYNQWDDKLTGAFEDTVLTTLDKNPTGKEKAANV